MGNVKKNMTPAHSKVTDPEELYTYMKKVHISKGKKMKYIIIACELDGERKYFLRGKDKLEYHKEILEDFKRKFLKKIKNVDYVASAEVVKDMDCVLKIEAIGGGRIERKSSNKIKIYGYSQAYGQAKHTDAADMISDFCGIRRDLIETSNKGY